MANYSIISSSTSTSYTGSITKMLSLGAEDVESTLTRIEWGNFVEPYSSFTPSSITTGTITVAAGSYVDGPISRVKTGATGNWLIYLNK